MKKTRFLQALVILMEIIVIFLILSDKFPGLKNLSVALLLFTLSIKEIAEGNRKQLNYLFLVITIILIAANIYLMISGRIQLP